MLCCLLVNTPILAFPTFKKPFILDANASDTGIGAVSTRVDKDGRECVILRQSIPFPSRVPLLCYKEVTTCCYYFYLTLFPLFVGSPFDLLHLT